MSRVREREIDRQTHREKEIVIFEVIYLHSLGSLVWRQWTSMKQKTAPLILVFIISPFYEFDHAQIHLKIS